MRRFTWIKQHDSMQCGASCLTMICHSCGLKYPLHYINDLCDTNSQGVSIRALDVVAKSLGFDTLTVKISEDRLSDLSLPAIIHWNQNHFVVLYKISKKGKRFYLSDPARGKVVVCREEFIRKWGSKIDGNPVSFGIVMMLEKKHDADNIYRRYRDVNHTKTKVSKDFINRNILKYKNHIFQIISGLILTCLIQLAFPFLTQAIVDKGILRNNLNLIFLILVGECVIIAAKAFTDFVRKWLLLNLSNRINISLITDFIEKLFKLPMRFFDSRRLGDLLQRMEDNSRIQSFITSHFISLSFNIITITVLAVVLAYYSITLFVIFLIFSVLYCGWILLFLNKRRRLDYEYFSAQGENQTLTHQLLSTMQDTKLHGCHQRRQWEWEDAQAHLIEVSMANLKLQQTIETGAIGINELKNILITILAASSVIAGDLTLGAMLAIQFIIGQLNSPISQLVDFIYAYQDLKISFERVNEIKTIDNEESDKVNTLADSIEHIELNDVSFKYNKFSSDYALQQININFERGKVSAIVGSSGCGKTTLIKLLLGYYTPETGSINVNNLNLKNLSLADWRMKCGIVMQEGVIYSDTILGNVCMSDSDCDLERFYKSLEIAGIKDYVESLPLKEATKIGITGKGLSLGQKQRILIARAIYRMPDVLIFDEATNSLDTINERQIVENLRTLYKDKVTIIIAHRLSTIKDADEIIVMDDGKIVEIGTYTSLISNKGHFFSLVKNQIEMGLHITCY